MSVYFGDCRDSLRQMIAEGVRVQMCVTSPPYFGLRSYLPEGHPDKAREIGAEKTPAEFVAALVEVFGLVRQVLADDGTLWVNLGDSYASSAGGYLETGSRGATAWHSIGAKTQAAVRKGAMRVPPAGLKQKDLIGIPWRVAFALQEAGWYLRQDIIWHKPNPMPESVTDRCTKAHEYLFLLSKSPRYYFDAEAIKEPVADSTVSRLTQPSLGHQAGSTRVPGKTNGNMKAVGSLVTRNRRSVWTIPTQPYSGAHFAVFPPALIEPCILAGSRPGDIVLDPFFGSGTTGEVAERLGRQWIGCELNPDNAPLQHERTAQMGMAL